jgi:molybdopterin molybdotransferase
MGDPSPRPITILDVEMSEFFTVRTVSDAIAGFRPPHRTAVEQIGVADAFGRVVAATVTAPGPLPGFSRSAVDGYAVRSADTHGAGEGLPAYLDLNGAVRMGELPSDGVGPGSAMEMPTGGALPEGADAVVMVEHTAAVDERRIEVTRSVASGDNVIRMDDDVAEGATLVREGHRLRPHDIGLLAAAGVVEVSVHRPPVVALISTGDEVVDAAETPQGAQVRDANAPALSALVRELGGEALAFGIVPDDPEHLERVCREALQRSDVVVVSAGSSVGARDATATVVERLGEPGVWCHGLALKPGKPTLLADVGGKPVIGLPGNPVSALVVMRLVGGPVVARAGGQTEDPVPPLVHARLARNVASTAGRTDVVQVALRGDEAVPLFGKAALLSVMTRADGFLVIPEDVQGFAEGTVVDVVPYR